MTKRKKLVIANWKMNPETHTEATELFNGIKKIAAKMQNIQTVICPPFVFLNEISQKYLGHRIQFGGQNLFYEESGKYTGEISPAQLYSSGADYVIVGHSERRELGETNEDVQKKIKIAMEHKLTPILCFGEGERDSHGKYLSFLRHQITTGLKEIKIKEINKVVLAYEPIWAIGKTGKNAITPQKLHETILFIRRVLRETYTTKIAEKSTIIYGGSVKSENCEELMEEGKAEGFLIGGASLKAESFNEILEITNN